MQFVDWEGRPALRLAGRAWVVFEPGGDWEPWNGAEVSDSGRLLLGGEEELRATFARWGALPPFPVLPSTNPTRINSHNLLSKGGEKATRQQFGARNANSSSLLAKIGIGLFFTAIFGYMSLGLETIEMMPSNAPIFINYSSGTYASPPCVFNGTTDVQFVTNLAEVQSGKESMKLANNVELITKDMLRSWQTVFGMEEAPRPDVRCRNSDGFMGHGSSWLIVALGYSKSRWADNGEWRW